MFWPENESQRSTFKGWLFLFALWVPGMWLRSLGLVACPFTTRATSPTFVLFVFGRNHSSPGWPRTRDNLSTWEGEAGIPIRSLWSACILCQLWTPLSWNHKPNLNQLSQLLSYKFKNFEILVTDLKEEGKKDLFFLSPWSMAYMRRHIFVEILGQDKDKARGPCIVWRKHVTCPACLSAPSLLLL